MHALVAAQLWASDVRLMLVRSLAFALACSATVLCEQACAQTRAVVELFTSQGCSSCPPADQLLGELAADPSLIVMSIPIDYWDYLGWKDTLADPRNTARQKAYARSRGDGQVYTPQAVVNGSIHALGSDREAIEQAIAKSRKNGAMSLPPVALSIAEGRVNIALPAVEGGAAAEAWLCGLVKTATVAISRGENKGRDITYHNVSRRWVKLGDWTGEAKSWSVPLRTLASDGIDEAAVLVQAGSRDKPRAILGAGFAALR
jgi:hypothetical protein